MQYVRVGGDELGPFGEFADFGAWYDSITFDRALTAAWARGQDPSLPADDNALIVRIAQTPEQGGGFVAGGQRMCLSNTRGGQTEPMRAADVPCPPGSGGISGSQVQEISAEELRRQLEEQKAREAAARTQPVETVEISGSVQRAGKQTLTAVTIYTGMTGFTHPTFGQGTGGEPMNNLRVEVDGQSARTNAQGRFTIRTQAPGVVAGRVIDSVGKVQEAVLVVIGGGSAVTDASGQFRIPLYVSELRGRVVDGTGRAVGGATVEIEVDPAYRSGRFDGRFDAAVVMGEGRWGPEAAAALTDASGIYYGIPYSVTSSAYVAASTTTNGAGVFSVKVPTGNYAVKVRASGFQDRRQGGIRVALGTPKDVGDIALMLPLTMAARTGGGAPAPAPTPDGTPKDGTPKAEPETPWYKSTGLWVGVAVLAVGSVGYLIWRDRQKKGR